MGTVRPSPESDGLRHIEVATLPVEREALAAIPSLRSDRVELAVAFPDRFDPAAEHPILITQVTADSSRSNTAEAAAYAATALARGYVVLTAQGIPWPDADGANTFVHRYAALRAALRWLASEIPASERWPIVLAGFSGGAKISQVLAFSLMLEHRRVVGVFLGGCNEDHSRVLLAQYPALEERFTEMAFFLSVGRADRIAPPEAVRAVAAHLRSAGVQRLRLSIHRGEHRLDTQDLDLALSWFRARM